MNIIKRFTLPSGRKGYITADGTIHLQRWTYPG
jgi:hypothetical protein